MTTKERGRGLLMLMRVDLPPGVHSIEFMRYALDEVRANVGALRPGDPLFALDRETVGVDLVAAGLPDADHAASMALAVLVEFFTGGAASPEHPKRDDHRRRLLGVAAALRNTSGGFQERAMRDAMVAVCEALAGVTS